MVGPVGFDDMVTDTALLVAGQLVIGFEVVTE